MLTTYLTELSSLRLLFLANLGIRLALLQKRLRNKHILGARHRADLLAHDSNARDVHWCYGKNDADYSRHDDTNIPLFQRAKIL